MSLLQRQFNQTLFDNGAYMSSNIQLLFVDVITLRCPNPDAGLNNLCL